MPADPTAEASPSLRPGHCRLEALKGGPGHRGMTSSRSWPSGSGKSTAMNTLAAWTARPRDYLFQASPVREAHARPARGCASASAWASSSRASTCWRAPARRRTSNCRCSTAKEPARRGARGGPRGAGVGGPGGCEHHAGRTLGGQQQRGGDRARHRHQPAVLIADEPTGNLDTQRATRSWSLTRLNREQASRC